MLARRLINQNYVGFVQLAGDGSPPLTSFSPSAGNSWYPSIALNGNATWYTGAYGDGYLLLTNQDNTDIAVSRNAGFSWYYHRSVLPLDAMVLAYGAGVFVAVSAGNYQNANIQYNTAAYSLDYGKTWTSTTLPSTQSWSSVAFGNGVFVAVSGEGYAQTGSLSSNAAAYSTDGGKTWIASTLPSSQIWSSVAYGDGVFIAVSSNGTAAAYSTDNGETWTASTLPFSGSGSSCVCYGAGSFVAAANNNGNSSGNVSAYSTDGGKTWGNSPNIGQDVNSWSSVAFGDGVFVIATFGNAMIGTSTTGNGWNEPIDAGNLQYCSAIFYVDPYS